MIMTEVRHFEIGEEVDVFIKIPGARKERGFYQQGVVKKKVDAGFYLVFFEHVECGGKRGQHGWYHWTNILYKGRKPNEKSET